MRRHWQYLKYVLRHKWFVFRACLDLGVPLWIAIFHDWDKFLPDEWFPYARTFYKPDGTKQYVESVDFARAWMLHQHRNKHHWQNFVNLDGIPLPMTLMLIWDRGDVQKVVERNSGGVSWFELVDVTNKKITTDPMPLVYRREMLADWIGAGLALGKPDTADWYCKNASKMILNDDTRLWIEMQLNIHGIA